MKKWTELDIHLLKSNYSSCEKVEHLSKLLCRSVDAIYIKARLLKLHRANTTTFKQGRAPYNKGTKGITPGGHHFKKGHVPANTKHFGKPFLAKVGGRLEWLHQQDGKTLLYKYTIFGEVPKGCCLVYKNGLDETKPPVKEDLMLISKADNMLNNSIHNYPFELKQTMFMLGKLKQRINESQ